METMVSPSKIGFKRALLVAALSAGLLLTLVAPGECLHLLGELVAVVRGRRSAARQWMVPR